VQQVVGAALDGHAQVAVVGGVGLPDEAVGQLVADQRLDRVHQVGDQRRGGGRAGRDRPAGRVHQLDDGEVAGQDDGGVVRGAGADHALGRAELVDHADAEGGGDAGARIGQELLAAAGDRQRGDPQPAGGALGGQQRQDRRVALQQHRPRAVEPLDDLGQRQRDRTEVTASSSPENSSGSARVAWIGEAAATIAIGTPPGGGGPRPSSRASPARVSPRV
jgi:hypothetical protein